MNLPYTKLTFREMDTAVLSKLTYQPQSTATILKAVRAANPDQTITRERVLSALSRMHGGHLVRNIAPMFWQKI